ncbi:phosphatidate cytidylyltransferase [Pseudazoarcus pumilus]|uniref:Phosphatidate cytidylyltransferase n=2 Tax=Pseudazoarcus pumilus TaxID=2067960 RepID=A0A2I6SAU8_9RHOO|nr:phosphatidate cytidylyltransferase [Pseudazoarcus pumilus]AUN96386.1 phosphatidate cytidylyltransferase [Pseudazoarcus pumilus]
MLKERVLTAAALVAGLLVALFLAPAFVWLLLVAIACALAAREWAVLAGFRAGAGIGYAAFVALACVAAGAWVDAVPSHGLLWLYGLAAGFWLVIAPLWMRHRWTLSGRATAAGVGLLVLLPAALALVHLRAVDVWLPLGAMGLVWVADIAAYFCGRRFGRVKLAPSISPGKTREGALGAVVAVILVGLALYAFDDGVLHTLPLLGWVALLTLLTLLSIAGDLFESLLKRQAGLKDSGTLLPGHGGVLDRIDSLTSTLPVIGLVVVISDFLT